MIHKYKLGGYNICLDVHSGAVHLLDDCAYDILDILEKKEKLHELPDEEVYAALEGK